MRRKRRTRPPDFKTKVALSAGDLTMTDQIEKLDRMPTRSPAGRSSC